MIKPNKANRLKRQIYTQGRQSKANEMNRTIKGINRKVKQTTRNVKKMIVKVNEMNRTIKEISRKAKETIIKREGS